jgi:DNA-binding NarL/FixJ family response regulator
LHCLIVDDSSILLKTARALLEREGISVVGVASNSAEALRLVGELRPDVTLVDIELGEESGLDLADRLALLDGHLQTISILISTHPEEDFADLIAASPAAGFLHKTDLSAKAIHALVEAAGES